MFAGRAAEDRVRVDARDDQRDDHEQHELLEEAEEPEREERDRAELREVARATSRSPSSASTASTREPGRERQQAPRAVASGSTIQSKSEDAPASARARGARRPTRARCRERGRPRSTTRRRRRASAASASAPRPRLVRRQLCPPGAERLEGVPERGLRRLLVERGVDVGDDERLDRRREPLQLAERRLDRLRRAGTRGRSGRRARRRPSATTSFGWTMCSSRVSQPRASSSAAPSANLTQFVP